MRFDAEKRGEVSVETWTQILLYIFVFDVKFTVLKLLKLLTNDIAI